MKAALYCRFPFGSPDDPDVLEQQLVLVELLEQIDGELYAIYVDRGMLSGNPASASYGQMLQDGQNHLFDVLLCITPQILCDSQKIELASIVTIFHSTDGTHFENSHTITL